MSAADQMDGQLVDQQPVAETVWERSTNCGPYLVFFTVFAALVLATMIPIVLAETGERRFFGLLFLVPLMMVVQFLRIRVRIDQHELRINSSILRFRLKRIPLDTIASAEVGFLSPNEWSGLGWPKPRGHSGVVLRSRDGLIVNLHDGERFAVSTRDPESAAAFLTVLLEKDSATAN
ncbi:hypothetical protein [Plantibacter sp. YIM 135347]|uniref:hypothetical protein n=1 Tax=Plantibacter sp. YIM 135347 TaxID=3423919 RepID=UPI003D3492C7